MGTVSAQQHAIETTRQEVRDALNAAGTKWTVQPMPGEGEEAWSPKQVAEHLIGAEAFFANNIAQVMGTQGFGRPAIDSSTAKTAAASYQRVGEQSNAIISALKDQDLTKSGETRMGELSVGQCLDLIANHGREHAQQIRAATA